ncbi:hypothetical protein L1987_09260 [Smallanthus sonchifolius]|uniref:Uncharacterized protein n=1 Tax=Smallanthus sonchifolius TaxID=185202 RepID=A0ACB9JNE8_9ASTR|nr:hypothetical protein L1987_09260 [Smallanthus sonchifolius]
MPLSSSHRPSFFPSPVWSMPPKKNPPPPARPSRRSTRGSARSSSALEGADLEALILPLVGLWANLEDHYRVPQLTTMVNPLEHDMDSRPNQTDSRSRVPPLPEINPEIDACRKNKEQSTVPGSYKSSESSSASVTDTGSVGLESAGKPGVNLPLTLLFSPSFKAKILGPNSLAAPIRVREPTLGQPFSSHGPPVGVHGVGSDEMAQSPGQSVKSVEPVGDVHATKPMQQPDVTDLEDGKNATKVHLVDKLMNPADLHASVGLEKVVDQVSGVGPRCREQILDKKCGVFGHTEDVHKPPPPPNVVETLVVKPAKVAPLIVTKRMKAHQSYKIKRRVRYFDTGTIPPHDIFMTWSTALNDFYYSLTKDVTEEVESEANDTADS